jgi:MoxR-like ATPase
MARIVLTQGGQKGREIELLDGEVVIGRDSDCSLSLDDSQVSRRHARVYCENGVWMLADLDSANGTLVNGVAITAVPLREADEVAIGETVFVFQNGEGDGTGQAASAAEPAAGAARERFAQPGALTTGDDLVLVEQMRECVDAIRQEVGKVIIGQEEVLNEILMCIIAGGHALLIGLPGLAKTLTVSTIAKVLDMKFKRIQFTPDLMPSDITGTEVLETDRETQQKEFRFMQGPIFCNLLLADEINRTPPKTQAALLEAMQEKQVSVGKENYRLDKPFFVLATQNPIEQEGTYPLPEAQLDRFMFNIFVDYPKRDEEMEIIARTTVSSGAEPGVVIDKKAVIHLQEVVRKIPVSDHVIGYVVNLVRSTRPNDEQAPEFIKKYVSTGAGPRAGQFLVLAAKARAVLEGRIHVSCNDIRGAAMPVLRHRILTNFAADSEGLKPSDIVKRLLAEVKEPGAETYEPAPKPAKPGKKK